MLLTLLTKAFNLSLDLNFKIGLVITIILHLKKKNNLRQICGEMENKRKFDRNKVREVVSD